MSENIVHADNRYCPTTYANMGCYFFTGDSVGNDGVWQSCQVDDGDPPGVVSGSTFTAVGYVQSAE